MLEIHTNAQPYPSLSISFVSRYFIDACRIDLKRYWWSNAPSNRISHQGLPKDGGNPRCYFWTQPLVIISLLVSKGSVKEPGKTQMPTFPCDVESQFRHHHVSTSRDSPRQCAIHLHNLSALGRRHWACRWLEDKEWERWHCQESVPDQYCCQLWLL